MALAADPPPLQVPPVDLCAVGKSAESAVQERLRVIAGRTDRLLAGLISLQWLAVAACAHRGGPLGMAGVCAAALSALSVVLSLTWPGRITARHLLALSLLTTSALSARLLGCHWEWHLPIFGALALLALYRDWRVLLSGGAAALLLSLTCGSGGGEPWVWSQPSAGVAAEDLLLLLFCRQSLREMRWLGERQALLRAADAVVSEASVQVRSSEEALHDARQRLARFHQEWEDGARERAEDLARTNDALQRNNSVLQAQQEATADGILVVNEDRDVSTYNRRFCELWQVPDGLMTADEDWTLMQHVLSRAKHPQTFLALMTRCYENPDEHARDEIEMTDGRILERSTQPIFSQTHQYYGRVWYFRDITERKRAETQIIGLNREMSLVNEAITRAYDATIEGWSRALDLRDKETEGHCQRVTDLTMRLAVAMGLCGDELIQIRRGALLHDIGKMGIPDQILLKPGPLDEDEWQIMRLHPQYAYEMLCPISFLRAALDIPWCHHEKWDGSGYPRGLSGAQIPLSARLFALVDVWDALRSNRPYRKAWTEERVCDFLRSESGTHFDPDLVPVFLSVVCAQDGSSGDDLFPALDFFSATGTLTELPWAA